MTGFAFVVYVNSTVAALPNKNTLGHLVHSQSLFRWNIHTFNLMNLCRWSKVKVMNHRRHHLNV